MAKKKSSETSGPRLFEFRDGKSDKFWEITVAGNSHTVRYGRVGTEGQSKTKEFSSDEKAQTDGEKLISQKTKKGYKEIVDKSESRSEKAVAGKQERKEHEPFLKAILEDPDSPDAYGVYADWLADRGDPRGEFIQLQWQLESDGLKAAARQKAKKSETALLRKYKKEWLDELAPEVTEQWAPQGEYFDRKNLYKVSFARGFLDSISTSFLFPEFAVKLRRSSHAQMLRELLIEYIPHGEELQEEFSIYEDKEWEYEDHPSLDALVGAAFPNLRRFVISEDDYGCHIDAPGIPRLLKNAPRLEVLDVGAHDMDTAGIFKAKLPYLRSLSVHHTFDYPIATLAKNATMGALESISFYPHATEDDDEPYIDLADIRAICRSKHLKSLKHIDMQCTDFGDQGIQEIVDSGLIARLETLKLPHGATTDEGVDILCESDLSNLRSLDLTGNYITPASVKKLKKMKVSVKAGELRDVANFDEKEHLYMGDYE